MLSKKIIAKLFCVIQICQPLQGMFCKAEENIYKKESEEFNWNIAVSKLGPMKAKQRLNI